VRPPEGEHNLLDLSLPLHVWCTVHIKNEHFIYDFQLYFAKIIS